MQAGSILHLCTKFEADSSFRSKVIRGSPNFEIGSRDPSHVHLWVVLLVLYSICRRGPSSTSVNVAPPLPKWTWPRSCDLISKFWDPLITLERIEQPASNLVQRRRTDPACVRNKKRPLNGRGLGHVTNFEILGPL